MVLDRNEGDLRSGDELHVARRFEHIGTVEGDVDAVVEPFANRDCELSIASLSSRSGYLDIMWSISPEAHLGEIAPSRNTPPFILAASAMMPSASPSRLNIWRVVSKSLYPKGVRRDAGQITEYRLDVAVLAIKSADRLHAHLTETRHRRRDGDTVLSHVETMLSRVPQDSKLLTVIVGHPATSSWLGGE